MYHKLLLDVVMSKLCQLTKEWEMVCSEPLTVEIKEWQKETGINVHFSVVKSYYYHFTT